MRKITKFRRSVRAISPVISVLLIIAIAVAAALIAYAWVTGYMDSTTTKVGKTIQIQSVTNNPPAIYVQNVGDSDVTLKSCYINGNLDTLASAQIDDTPLAKSETHTIDTFTYMSAFNERQIRVKVVTTDGTSAEYIKTFPRTYTQANIPPIAIFTWSADGLTVDFDGTRSFDLDGTIESYVWTSDGTQIGTGATLTHTYATEGTYTVRLTVTDDQGASRYSQRAITATTTPPTNNPPNAEFTFSPLDPEIDETVTFTDESTDSDGTIVSWAWNFGDGATSTQQNPTHIYTSAATYTVTLTVTDNNGATNYIERPITVTETTPANTAPTAAFTYLPTNPAVGEQVTFTDASTDPDGTIVSWAWDFGDSETSPLQNPTHTYTSAGIYTVNLTVTDDDGATGTTTKPITVTATPPTNNPPNAAFTYLPTNPAVGEQVTFTDASTDPDGTIVGWVWTFGDGATSTQQNPPHTYTSAATYMVTLTVTDDDGATDIEIKQITVTEAPPANVPPTADFTFSPSDPETDETVTFTDASTDPDGTIVSWEWDFGDSETSTDPNPTHAYSAAGTYTVTLTVTDDDGAIDHIEHDVTVTAPNIAPTAAFTWESNGLAVDFDGTSSTDPDGTIVSYEWNFGDGNTATGTTTDHTYAAEGTYTVRLTVTDDQEATDYIEHDVTVTTALTAKIYPKSIQYSRGIPDSGQLSDMTASDDNYYVSYSQTGSSTIPRIEYYCTFDIDDVGVSKSSITQITITLEGHYSTSEVSQTVSIYYRVGNYGWWQTISTTTEGTTDTTITLTITNIDDYINPYNGEILIQLVTDAGAGNPPYYHYNDLFQVAVTYTP